MAAVTTVQDILDGAYGTSTKNQPETIANEAVELLAVVKRKLAGIYAFASRINPIHFSASEDVTGVAGQWERPEAANAIFRIEDAAFAEVVVVPYDDRLAAEPKISLYEFGGLFTADPAQSTPPGDTDDLTFWYSKRPIDPNPDDLTGVLDPDWDDAYSDLLIYELALYLSLKDGRESEVQLLKEERNQWARVFASYLEHSTANLQRRFGHRKSVDVETLLPLLTGGA
jgi:hypothetical protein